MSIIISLLTGTIGRYLILAAVSIGFLAWVRADAASPYKTEIIELRRASQQKDAIIKDQADRFLADQAETTRLENQLSEILNATDQTNACLPSAVDLDKLRKL